MEFATFLTHFLLSVSPSAPNILATVCRTQVIVWPSFIAIGGAIQKTYGHTFFCAHHFDRYFERKTGVKTSIKGRVYIFIEVDILELVQAQVPPIQQYIFYEVYKIIFHGNTIYIFRHSLPHLSELCL